MSKSSTFSFEFLEVAFSEAIPVVVVSTEVVDNAGEAFQSMMFEAVSLSTVLFLVRDVLVELSLSLSLLSVDVDSVTSTWEGAKEL